jgi:flagellar assembly protein FliH
MRRPLGRPGSAPAASGTPVAVAPVLSGSGPDGAPLPTPAEIAARMAAESSAALARASTVLEEAEAQRQAWEAQEAAARASLDAAREELARREQSLQTAQRAHEEALHGAHEAAAQRGYEEGLARGAADGRAGADAALAVRLEQMDALARAMDAASATALVRQEDMLVEVAWTAICRLAGELALSRDGALAMVRVAAAEVRETQGLRIRVHPQDAEWLGDAHEAPKWSLEADPAVGLGGCIIESGQGSLDARLELQLDRLRQALSNARAMRSTALVGEQG